MSPMANITGNNTVNVYVHAIYVSRSNALQTIHMKHDMDIEKLLISVADMKTLDGPITINNPLYSTPNTTDYFHFFDQPFVRLKIFPASLSRLFMLKHIHFEKFLLQ